MADARLEVRDAIGTRTVALDKATLTIGRRTEHDIALTGSDVSRDHASVTRTGDGFLLKDTGSRYGTSINGAAVTERLLQPGDVIRLGRTGETELVFLSDGAGSDRRAGSAVGDLRQVATLLEGLRAMGSGRVLDEVLALVMDSAITVTGAERGFIMLADADGVLEMKLARARGGITLPGRGFETSRKIPEEVFATGQPRIVADLLDGDLANVHVGTVALGIRHVLCTPLRLVRYVERDDASAEQRSIGVLYLDSRERGTLLSETTRAGLETLATEAAVAIQNARLYRAALEKAKMEHELRIAADIQQGLLPVAPQVGTFYDAMGSSMACRSIGGDFFDFLDLPGGSLGCVLGDVAGKGAPAALLMAVLHGVFSSQAATGGTPARLFEDVNRILLRRSLGAKYATAFYAVLSADGTLVYSNAGQNPPLLVGPDGVERLDAGGRPLGLFDASTYVEDRRQLVPGDLLVLYSDGVTEALSASGEEFGDERLLDAVGGHRGEPPQAVLERLLAAVREFTRGAVQNDDVTAIVLRYVGASRNIQLDRAVEGPAIADVFTDDRRT